MHSPQLLSSHGSIVLLLFQQDYFLSTFVSVNLHTEVFPGEPTATCRYNCTGSCFNVISLLYSPPVAPPPHLSLPAVRVTRPTTEALSQFQMCRSQYFPPTPLHLHVWGRRADWGGADETEVHICVSRPMMRDLSFTLC